MRKEGTRYFKAPIPLFIVGYKSNKYKGFRILIYTDMSLSTAEPHFNLHPSTEDNDNNLSSLKPQINFYSGVFISSSLHGPSLHTIYLLIGNSKL